jgi:ABC-type microcin C transport system duplicated ATPase subunit YejF
MTHSSKALSTSVVEGRASRGDGASACRERAGYDRGGLDNARTLSTRAEPTCLIEVIRLSISHYLPYETANCALHESLQISAGGWVGVVSETEARKNTLALTLMGLPPRASRVTGGSILFGGRNILDLDEDELRKIQSAEMVFIFWEPAAGVNPATPVGDQISEVLRAHCNWDRDQRKNVVEERLRKVLEVSSKRVAIDTYLIGRLSSSWERAP